MLFNNHLLHTSVGLLHDVQTLLLATGALTVCVKYTLDSGGTILNGADTRGVIEGDVEGYVSEGNRLGLVLDLSLRLVNPCEQHVLQCGLESTCCHALVSLQRDVQQLTARLPNLVFAKDTTTKL